CTGDVLVVGDAAGHTIPTFGGGIPPALICGRIAGRVVADHVRRGVPLSIYERRWRGQLGETLENALRLRRMSDIVFGSERAIDFVARRGWFTEEMVMTVVLCRMDMRMRLVERALHRLMG
ncbi:MAG: NAD(P)/FAD-dependent oxidoreductase, partial [Candidatus Bathyarchaeia archaeon]